MLGCPAQKAARFSGGLFLLPLFPIAHLFRNCRDAEGAEREIDDAVRAKDDHEPDDAPHNRLLPFGALRLVSRVCDELKYAPNEDHERTRREEQDKRINNLHDDLVEKRVESGH